MPLPIPPFARRQVLSADSLNRLVDALNVLLGLRGDGLVRVTWTETGPVFSLNVPALRPRVGWPPPLRYAKVTAIYNGSDASWTNFATDRWQSHCNANPCEGDGDNVITGDTVTLKLTEAPAAGVIGFADVAVNDIVAFAEGDDLEAIPGRTPAATFDGAVVAHAGPDGAVPSVQVGGVWLTFDAGGNLVHDTPGPEVYELGAENDCTWRTNYLSIDANGHVRIAEAYDEGAGFTQVGPET